MLSSKFIKSKEEGNADDPLAIKKEKQDDDSLLSTGGYQ
jgi:hypothetical protein